ncbi:MAG: hypothetical protein HON40_00600 [Flavobacteriales bacterium]|jgi:hypothetical protein|nr:hypothetical protein [Flavobacteriales bacterium]MBT4881031.1 hypothetical protein [Flavobacteriales bacterium]MDG1349299.1 hypothetical protein [Flavobacteriales bacterium]|tara:strand:- start:1167 stop:1943 length:777 start_codon:yes stop_codon:yes gene_type:complete
MKKLLLLCTILFVNSLSAQHIYKNRKFFGGSFYINNESLKDVTLDGNTADANGIEYWNNTPFVKKQPKHSKTNSRIRFDMRYGWFPIDMLALGGDFDITSNSYNSEDTSFMMNTYMQNKSSELTIGPFVRWYMFEIGGQPYEIGALFLEGAYKFGTGTSTDTYVFEASSDTFSVVLSGEEKYSYLATKATAKLGFSMYLSDFISHNWFTGFLIALEPSVQYDWITRQDMADDPLDGITKKRKEISTGIRFNIALVSYF